MIKYILVMWLATSPGSIFGTADLNSAEECEALAVKTSAQVAEQTGVATLHLCQPVDMTDAYKKPSIPGYFVH